MTPEPTNEEKLAAATKLAALDTRYANPETFSFLWCDALDLQIALTRREKQIAEAREILSVVEDNYGRKFCLPEAAKVIAWLEATR